MSERLTDLTLLRTGFKAKLGFLLSDCSQHLPSLRVFESIRSPGRQDELYARGRVPGLNDFGRTVTRAGAYQSAHQYGLGVDLVFYEDGKWTWDGDWATLRRLANTHGLMQLSFEQPHIQTPDFDWRSLQAGPRDADGWLAWLTSTHG